MRRRNCEDCKHYKITRERGMDFNYCEVWDCQFESREDDDENDHEVMVNECCTKCPLERLNK